MRKYIFLFLLLVNILLLCSCSVGCARVIFDDTDKKADKRLEKILEIMQNKDQDAFETLFSKQASDETDNFDENMEYLFDFFQGSVKSWKRDRFMSEGLIENGKKSVIPITWYTVTTDKYEYKFFIIDYIENSIDPDCVGLYTLRVIKAEDEETQFASWQKMRIPGIYKPEE